MTGLILKLAPSERVLINGAVIENGDRRAKISIRTPNANILRLKDAIHPDKARTPVSRVYYICQLILTGEVDPEEGHQQLPFEIKVPTAKTRAAMNEADAIALAHRARFASAKELFDDLEKNSRK